MDARLDGMKDIRIGKIHGADLGKRPVFTHGFGLSSELLAEAASATLGGVENFNGSGTGVS